MIIAATIALNGHSIQLQEKRSLLFRNGWRIRIFMRKRRYMFSTERGLVAQICNLPYRRFVIGRASESSSPLALTTVPQNAILRYSRLQIRATASLHGEGTVCRVAPHSPT